MKTSDGRNKGRIRLYCKALEVSRQAFYDYLERKNKLWKYQPLAEEMLKIHNEDEYNDTYGRNRMYMALKMKYGYPPDTPHFCKQTGQMW